MAGTGWRTLLKKISMGKFRYEDTQAPARGGRAVGWRGSFFGIFGLTGGVKCVTLDIHI